MIPASRLWLLLPRAISVLPRRVPQDLGSGCSFRAPERADRIHFPDRMYHFFFSISESTSTSTPTQGSRLRLEFRAPERADTTRDNQTRTLRYQCVGAVCSDSCIRRKEQRPAVCGWEPYVVIPALGGRREAGPRRSVGRSQ